MLTPEGVGFYSYMVVKVFGDAAGNVDEVISPRFLFLSSFPKAFGLNLFMVRRCLTCGCRRLSSAGVAIAAGETPTYHYP